MRGALDSLVLNILIKWNWNTSSGSLDRLEYDAFEILFLGLLWFLTWKVAKEEQGDAVGEHTARGGQLGSRGTAFWVGVATLAALVVTVGAVNYVYQYRKIVVIGAKDQVLYSGLATKANAMALGNALKSHEYFQDRGSSVLLNKGFGDATISFVLQEGVWDQPGMLSSFEELSRELAPTVSGFPVQVQLVNTVLAVQATSTVGEVNFDGKDGIYYEGSATRAEAEALGHKFKSIGFFKGKGVNVFLTRHDDDRTLAFVIVREVTPRAVSSLEAIVRDVAPTVGGLPINMHLVNPQLEVVKDEVIK